MIIYSFVLLVLSFKSLMYLKYFCCREWGRDLTFFWDECTVVTVCCIEKSSLPSTELKCHKFPHVTESFSGLSVLFNLAVSLFAYKFETVFITVIVEYISYT